MPIKRLEKARESLPAAYQFGDAGPTVSVAETMHRRFAICVPFFAEQERERQRLEHEYVGDRWPDEVIAMRCR